MSTLPFTCYEFGPFRLDPIRRRLWREGTAVPLRPKAFELLVALAERSGQDVEKDELIRLVWPDAIVEENNLPHTISKLRKALNERIDQHDYIVTLPGRGYRFVARVTAVAAAAAGVTAGARSAVASPPDQRRTRLIVLPFRFLRADPDIEFFAVSLSDAVTNSLSGLESLVVRSSATAARCSAGHDDLQVVAAKANVDMVLTGTLLRAGEQLRLSAQLVEVPSGAVRWSQTCQVTLGNILHVQDDLVRRIVGSLSLPLTAHDDRRLTHQLSTRAIDSQLYAAYLKGRYYFNRRTPDGLKRAIACFEAAIERDPKYGPAYAGLADCYILGGASALSRRDSIERAKVAATTALALDDELAEAHASLAAVACRWDWDWAQAETEFKRAIELNPHGASVRHGYALFLAALRRFPEALEQINHASEIDPLSLVASAGVGRVLDFARRHDEAIEHYQKTIDIDSGFADAYFDLAMAHVHRGRYEDALAAGQRAVALVPDSLVYAECVAYTRALMGCRAEAENLFEIMDKRSQMSYVSPALRAHLLLGLGRIDEAFAQLSAACDERAGEVMYLNADPDCDNIRSDPRFDTLLRRIGFPS